MGYSKKILDKSIVKVNKTQENMDITLGLWNRLLTNSRNLDQIHLNSVLRDDQPQILYLLLLKLTFLWVEKEFVFS